MGWEYLVVLVIAAVVASALAPKPQAPKAAVLEDFSAPTAEEGRPIPVVFGEVDVKGSNVLWYGDLTVQPIRRRP